MSDPLLFLWQLLEPDSNRFPADSVNRWPDGMFDKLTEFGLLTEADLAEFVTCNACDQDHVARVQWRELSGESIPVLHCPENGPVRVDVGRLAQWSPNWKVLAKRTADALRPKLSKECFRRTERGRITADDCAAVLELLSGLPSEAELRKRTKTPKDPDAEYLAWVTAEMAPQPAALTTSLWSNRYETDWDNLPPGAFRDPEAVTDNTRYEALRDLQKLCNHKDNAHWGLTLTISSSRRKTKLIKPAVPPRGK